MSQYKDGEWLEPKKPRAWLTEPEHDVVNLAHRVTMLERELSALIDVIAETCRAAEVNRQAMPPKLSAWWAKHR